MTAKSVESFCASQSRLRAANFQDIEEKENADYAESHNLQALFSDFAQQLREKDPKTEQDAEKILLDLLSHRKAERDRAALRLHFHKSFEVNLDNGRKALKVTPAPECASLHIEQKTRAHTIDDTYNITLEQMEELTELFYELGRFVVENPKGEKGGFITVDEKDVYLLGSSKECSDVGDELFSMALHMGRKRA